MTFKVKDVLRVPNGMIGILVEPEKGATIDDLLPLIGGSVFFEEGPVRTKGFNTARFWSCVIPPLAYFYAALLANFAPPLTLLLDDQELVAGGFF